MLSRAVLIGLGLLALGGLAPRAAAEAPFAFATTPGKLPKTVVPAAYDLTITPDIEAGTFRGSVRITLDVREPVRQFVLNSLGLEITHAEIEGRSGPGLVAVPDVAAQTVTLALEGSQPAGTCVLVLEFTGKLGEQPQGLYVVRYQKDGRELKGLATQFEPADARRMFPCWDEPAFRAAFTLRVELKGSALPLSNMPWQAAEGPSGEWSKVTFQTTPRMPTYLLALFAGEFERLDDKADGVNLSIFTTPGKREQARYAMEVTKEVLRDFAEYFGTKYPLPKLDQIALPNTGAGGMENWGAIVYREDLLLFDPATSSEAQKQRVYGIVAHEIAHQWFGNLVTMAWWDNLWLNEGFASWMATKQMALRQPAWKPWLRAAAGRESAMRLDARATTHPIQMPVRTESDAADVFDEITYQKGQAVLRMLEAWLGEDVFRDGVRRYMKAFSFSNTTTADLWDSLGTASGKDVGAFAKGWTEQPGFPVVVVGGISSPGGGVPACWQQRFTVHQPDAPALSWLVPLSYAPAGNPESALTAVLGAKEPLKLTLEPEDAVKVNVGGVGYYRTEYAGIYAARILKAVPHMAEADRLNLLQDQWALAQAGREKVTRYLRLADALIDTATPTELEQILGVLWQIDRMKRDAVAAGSPPERLDAFRSWALAFLRPQIEKLGWDAAAGEAPLVTQLRPRVLALSAAFGDKGTLRIARSRFASYLADPATLDADLRGIVLTIIGREADAETWGVLHALGRKAASFEQKRELYSALAAVRDPALAALALALSLTHELPPRDATRLVSRVADAGEHAEAAWAFARENRDALFAKLTAHQANEYVPELLTLLPATEARAVELEAWAAKNLPPGAGRSVAKAADEIRFQADFRKRVLGDIEAWYASKLPPPANAAR